MSQSVNQLTLNEIRLAVAEKYGRVASFPDADHPFPIGRDFALSLGYDPEQLEHLPRRAVDAFAGISNPLIAADLRPGEIVLDLGCGAGMDTLLIANRVGPSGFVHGVDLSDEMLACARDCAAEANFRNIGLYQVPAEAVPLGDSSVDVMIINGIFNLCPDKYQVMTEAYRLLRPGGRMLVSEIVVRGKKNMGCENISRHWEDLPHVSLDDWFR